MIASVAKYQFCICLKPNFFARSSKSARRYSVAYLSPITTASLISLSRFVNPLASSGFLVNEGSSPCLFRSCASACAPRLSLGFRRNTAFSPFLVVTKPGRRSPSSPLAVADAGAVGEPLVVRNSVRAIISLGFPSSGSSALTLEKPLAATSVMIVISF